MDCRVVVEAGVPVYDVETADEAVRIAISKTGEMINPDLSYVEIDVAERTGPDEDADPAFVVAGAALVALTFEMDVFNVDRTEHASRIAHTELGDRLVDIPLEVLTVEELDEDTEHASATADESTDDAPGREGDATSSESGEGAGVESEGPVASGDSDGSSETARRAAPEAGAAVLPSFEELLEK